MTRDWRFLLIAAGFILLPAVWTWPLALHLTGWFPGDRPTDAMIHTRQLWWTPQALGSLSNPYVSPVMLYPQGARLYFETLVPISGVLAWLPGRLLGPIAAYNLVVLGMLGASGLAAWALATRVTGSRAAGAIGGLVYATSPYLLNHVRVGHLGVISAVWIPLSLLALLQLLRTHQRRWLVLSGVLLAATAYSDLQGAMTLTLVTPLLLIASAWRKSRPIGDADASARLDAMRAADAPLSPGQSRWTRGLRAFAGDLGPFVASGALAIVLTAPLLLGIVSEIRDGMEVNPPEEHALRNSADLVAFVSPQPLHPLWGAAMRNWYHLQQIDLEDESVVYPGLVVLALAVIGLLDRRTRRPLWAVLAVLMALLSLGPLLHLGGPEALVALPFGLPTPYALLQQIPYVAIGRTPARFMGLGMLALGTLGAAGVAALARSHQAEGRGWVGAVAALLIGFEFLAAPFPVTAPQVPGGYRYVVEQGCGGPLLELPVDAGGADQKARMFFQTLHGCAISGGYVSRGSDTTELTAEWRRVIRQDDPRSRRAQQLAERVRSLGFRYLVIWKPVYESPQERNQDLRLVRTLFPAPPVYEDDETAVYRLDDG